MKIIIVGGGISGLSTYLFFRQSFARDETQYEIKIYEKYAPRTKILSTGDSDDVQDLAELSSSTAIVGGGLGISPNGMRILSEVSPELHAAVLAQGFPCEKFIFRSSRGWKLSESASTDGRGESCVAGSRHGLWKCLSDAVGEGVVHYRKIVKVMRRQGRGKCQVMFEDSEVEEADLIIGADGVKSVVKDGIFPGEEFAPIYECGSTLPMELHQWLTECDSKLIGVGGFLPIQSSKESLDNKAMVFTFGPNGFFGYSPSSASDSMWWSTVQADALPNESRIALSDLRQQLKKHHGNWKDPFIKDIIKEAHVDHVYPCWTTPELPQWSKDGLILVGDAAHALNPTSGQGSSQALEDAKTLSICFSRFLAESPADTSSFAAVDNAAELYYSVRSPRLRAIAARTARLANTKKELTFAEEMITCAFFWLIGKFPSLGKMLIGDVNKELYGWDVHAEIRKHIEATKEPSDDS